MWEALSKLAVVCVSLNHLLSSFSPYSMSKKFPVGIFPPLDLQVLKPMAFSIMPNSNSYRSSFCTWNKGLLLCQALTAHTFLQTTYWIVWFKAAHILGFTDVQSWGLQPNFGEIVIRHKHYIDNRSPSRRVLATHWHWFKCPYWGPLVQEMRMTRNIWLGDGRVENAQNPSWWEGKSEDTPTPFWKKSPLVKCLQDDGFHF